MKYFGNIVDVVNRNVFSGFVNIENGVIVDIGTDNNVYDNFILPGFVDSHVHIESSMLVPSEFARLSVQHGVVGAVADPHEIANVCGINGIDFMIENAKLVDYKFYFGVPSCVPATSFETSGFELDSNHVTELLQRNDMFFLAEMMNYPGVIYQDKEVWAKINAAKTIGKPIDGHAPVSDEQIIAKYAASGISTDHESFLLEEALFKINNGMKILIREGSAAKNFDELSPLINMFPNDVMFCTDDCHPDDLLFRHISFLVRKSITLGYELFNVLRAAIYNPIMHYKLNIGLLQKGDSADFIIVKDLKDFQILKTVINGNVVFDGVQTLIKSVKVNPINNFVAEHLCEDDIKLNSRNTEINVIQVIDKELITKKIIVKPYIENGFLESNINTDILKIIVLNRYSNSKPVVGFINGFGFKNGAVASSIAHDSHNVIAVGTSDKHLISAINKLIDNKGGIVVSNQNGLVEMQLNVGGLMTFKDGFEVANEYLNISDTVKQLGSSLTSPLMTLSFMSLLVIPEIKIGDKGLFDSENFQFISLYA